MAKRTPEEEKARFLSLLERENELKSEGYTLIAGIDEAGRGPLAGRVYAAAVILPQDIIIEGLDDSKKSSEKKREMLFSEICEKAIAYSIQYATEEEIDEINILNDTHLAMNRAADGLKIKPDYCIIDGNSIKNMSYPHETMVKGDAKSASIAAASILAKVSRDRFITELSE